ncbi:hypothetical protein SHAQ108633_15715 [Shewanella aquimarina]
MKALVLARDKPLIQKRYKKTSMMLVFLYRLYACELFVAVVALVVGADTVEI